MFTGNVLAIGAHPDDIEYGVFGTLCKFRDDCSIFCFVATAGGLRDSTSGILRKIESEIALNLLNPNKVFWEDKIGIDYQDYAYITFYLEKIIDLENINLILAPDKSDSHQDHRLISDITVSASRRSNATVLFYPTLSTVQFNAKLFVDISEVFNKKKEALSLLVSQKDKPYMMDEYLEIFNHDAFASLHGLNYVEKFDIGGAFL